MKMGEGLGSSGVHRNSLSLFLIWPRKTFDDGLCSFLLASPEVQNPRALCVQFMSSI